jgi:hypothetical protein
MSYLRYSCLFARVVSNTYCVEFLFCFASSCVPFLIASFSGLFLRYSFIDSNGVCQVFYKLIKILHFIMIRKKIVFK